MTVLDALKSALDESSVRKADFSIRLEDAITVSAYRGNYGAYTFCEIRQKRDDEYHRIKVSIPYTFEKYQSAAPNVRYELAQLAKGVRHVGGFVCGPCVQRNNYDPAQLSLSLNLAFTKECQLARMLADVCAARPEAGPLLRRNGKITLTINLDT